MPFSLTSPAFAAGSEIPAKHTCDGVDLAPPLQWSGVPGGAKSLALVVDDPDAKPAPWVHWVVFDLAPGGGGIPEGGKLPRGAVPGTNDWKQATWGGPCPPFGRHRYIFRLYALDVDLGTSLKKPTKAELEAAMKGHVLAKAELMGTYEKRKR